MEAKIDVTSGAFSEELVVENEVMGADRVGLHVIVL